MLCKQIRLDLERYYYFKGKQHKKVTLLGVVLNSFNPRVAPVILVRLSGWLVKIKLTPFAKITSLFNFVIFGIEVSLQCKISGGLFFPHTVGTVIGAESIGNRCVIYHGATLGAKKIDFEHTKGKRPVVGNDVVIGSGAKILGGITIGDNVVIAANALLVEDVPSNCMVSGNPATIVKNLKGAYYG